MTMGIEVKLPVIVHVDNVGAIFMAENVTMTGCTKHIDIRYHYAHKFVEDGFVKIIFVRTTENYVDQFTKNVTGDIYDVHVKSFLGTKGSI
jgi:hypothetical protein